MNPLFATSAVATKHPSKDLLLAIASGAVQTEIDLVATSLRCDVAFDDAIQSRPALVIVELGERQEHTATQIDSLRKKWDGVQVLGLASWHSLYEGKINPACVVDDLLFLPAKPADFQYRVKRHLANQPEVSSEQAKLTYGVVEFDLQSLQISIGEKKLRVTKREYELLLYFARQSPRPVNHREIADKVLKLAKTITTYENVINVHVARVRAKLKEISEEHRLRTSRGTGFSLDV